MAIDRGSETTTKLLTLLNVSATKAGKRPWIEEPTKPGEKLNKRRARILGSEEDSEKGVASEATPDPGNDTEPQQPEAEDKEQEEVLEDSGEYEWYRWIGSELNSLIIENKIDSYEEHFGANTTLVTDARREIADQKTWKTTKGTHGKLGAIVTYGSEDLQQVAPKSSVRLMLLCMCCISCNC